MGRYAIFVVFGLFLTMNYFVISGHKSEKIAIESTVEMLNRRMAQNVATGFANITLNRLRVDQVGVSGFSQDEYTITNKKLKRPLGAKVNLIVDNFETDASLDVGEYRVTSTVEYEDVTVETVVFDRQLPFSYWALFLNNFPSLYYGNGEGADGPVHVNGKLGVGQNPGPVWKGNVTTTGGVKYYGISAGSYTGFKGDNNNFNHRGITMPSNLGLTAAAISSSFKLDNVFPHTGSSFLHLDLWNDGSGNQYIDVYDVYPTDPKFHRASWITTVQWNNWVSSHKKTIPLSSVTDGIMYSQNKNIRISGELDGQMTISTEKKMYITDDVVYEEDPRTTPESDDLLGLMAEDGMIVCTGKDPYTGYRYNNDFGDPHAAYPGCTIMANMYTPSYIKIENYNDGKRGDWTVVGGRVQNTPQQTWSGSGSRWTGFKEVISYDSRLRKMTPPGIPYTMERRISRWKETF